MSERLPSFLVVGAQKAGTTALHEWLMQQPDVSLPTIKETHYFSHSERHHRGLGWYLRQFQDRGSDAVVGEVDPEYMFSALAASRIRSIIPKARFVFLLRNPLERALSQYLMSVRRGYEQLDFSSALQAEQGRLAQPDNQFSLDHHSYAARGEYAGQIRSFLETFPDSAFLFIKFDDLVSVERGMQTYRDICAFLGVKSPPELANRTRISNQASEPRSTLLRDALYGDSRLKRAIGRFVPSKDVKLRVALFLDRLNQKPLRQRERVGVETIPADLIELFVKQTEEAALVTGLDLSNWLAGLKG